MSKRLILVFAVLLGSSLFAATLPAHVVLEELLLIPRALEVEGWS